MSLGTLTCLHDWGHFGINYEVFRICLLCNLSVAFPWWVRMLDGCSCQVYVVYIILLTSVQQWPPDSCICWTGLSVSWDKEKGAKGKKVTFGQQIVEWHQPSRHKCRYRFGKWHCGGTGIAVAHQPTVSFHLPRCRAHCQWPPHKLISSSYKNDLHPVTLCPHDVCLIWKHKFCLESLLIFRPLLNQFAEIW